MGIITIIDDFSGLGDKPKETLEELNAITNKLINDLKNRIEDIEKPK